MKIGMTGCRNGLSKSGSDFLEKFLNDNAINITEAHHGDCVGSDADFHGTLKSYNIADDNIYIHPPKDKKFRAFCKGGKVLPEKNYIDRNHDIVDDSDMLIAFPSTEHSVTRSGTWATVRYAKKTNKKIIIVYPSGNIDYIN
jgi:hypothetical protein